MYCVNIPCIYKSMQGIRVLPSMERLHYISLNAVTQNLEWDFYPGLPHM